MQFRAGIVYVALFLVVAAGAYGLIATAEPPQVTMDAADADHQLSENESFEVNGTTYDVTELSGGSGTIQQVNESAVHTVSWSDGDTVQLAEGEEFTVIIGGSEDGGNESDNESPSSFTLRGSLEDYETVERDDGQYVVIEEENTTELVPVDEFDELPRQTFEVGDTVEFYESEREEMVQGTVTDISSDSVTAEYEAESVEEFSLEHEGTVTLNDQEFAVYFPSDDEAYLSSDVESFQSQQQAVSDFHERVRGLWWVVSLSLLTAVLVGALAYLPVRG